MPTVPSEIDLAFEVLDESLSQYAQLDAAQTALLAGAFTTIANGNRQAEVRALMTGPIGRPDIPVSPEGTPSLVDCWSRVLAAIEAYNALGTGLQLEPQSSDPQDPPTPHCIQIVIVGDVVRVVYNYQTELTFGGRTEPVYELSDAAGVGRQVLAIGHVAITVPVGAN